MSDTRVLPPSQPRSTGIPRTTQTNGRPVHGGSGPASHVTTSPAAGAAAAQRTRDQQTAQSNAAARQAQSMSGSSHPGATRIAPGVQLMQQAGQRPGGRPPQVARIDLSARSISPFTIDEVILLGQSLDAARTAELARPAEEQNAEMLVIMDSAMGKLVQTANELQNEEAARAAATAAPAPVQVQAGRVTAPVRGAVPNEEA